MRNLGHSFPKPEHSHYSAHKFPSWELTRALAGEVSCPGLGENSSSSSHGIPWGLVKAPTHLHLSKHTPVQLQVEKVCSEGTSSHFTFKKFSGKKNGSGWH